ncbi:Cardiolipin synthetase (plasmid) [Acidisarcina polymorpha]|uniref:phospholipase D n=1 Tax=Acidisarcina polymorpha TaxID=2211140 RepID=A0A2Z5GB52_9BACT|nr:phospholipase D-like domain-containing protein [Acidisarcina polymorpha]AXC16037.1 Cardiolipin synthetase [Acidisarcina polymorpha]
MARSLIVLPDDSAAPILNAIQQAKTSLHIKMFVFSDAALVHSVLTAHQRKVKVRVMLNPARRSGQEDNLGTRGLLERAGIEVLDSNPAYDITHEKSVVIDGRAALIQSLNWESKNFEKVRDYAVMTTHKNEVAEIVACFEADWHRAPFAPGSGDLLWCKGNARERIAHIIDAARHSLIVQNERYQDPVIIERLVRARRRGVKVHMFARAPHMLKQEKLVEGLEGLRIMDDVGIKIHTVKHLKLHAKMLLADGERAIIGSINLTPGSFDSRRELAIEVTDKHVVNRLHQVAAHDWEHSRPLDLSDQAILEDLKGRLDPCGLALDCAPGR